MLSIPKRSLLSSNRRLTSRYRINSYEATYEYVNKLLELTKQISGHQSWRDVKDICDKNYFYDRVSNLVDSNNITYDFYIPNDHSFISNGFVSHNSWLCAAYALLRALLYPNEQIVVVSFTFKQVHEGVFRFHWANVEKLTLTSRVCPIRYKELS